MLPEVEAVSLVGVGVTFASAVGVPLGAARLTGAGACVEVAASGGAAYVPSHAWVTSWRVGSGRLCSLLPGFWRVVCPVTEDTGVC